jgi:hypothetical protein
MAQSQIARFHKGVLSISSQCFRRNKWLTERRRQIFQSSSSLEDLSSGKVKIEVILLTPNFSVYSLKHK